MSEASEAAFRSYLRARRKVDRARALDQLLVVLRPMMVRVAHGIVDVHDVDDVVQEALASVAAPGLLQLRQGKAMREGPRSLGALVDAYAVQVTRQKALMHLRRERARGRGLRENEHAGALHEQDGDGWQADESQLSAALPMEELLDTAEDLERMRLAIVTLRRVRPRWAMALEIVRKGGRARQVARRLGVSHMTARKILERARKGLRELLMEEPER